MIWLLEIYLHQGISLYLIYKNIQIYKIKGKQIYKKNHDKLTKQQLFNYLIQSYETETNMQVIKELDEFLKDKKSTLILYVYDSFLFDFSKEDGKETLIKIKEIVSKKHPIKIKIGKNYDVLEAL